jgi:ATP-dependent DNA helicase PIF1
MFNQTPICLNDEFRLVLDQLEKTNNHYFITGKAGTGKSTLLNIFRNTTRKKVVVLAPTGIAALNVKGQTIHSFFKFPPRLMQQKEIVKSPNHRLYKNIDMMIIDEISMVRADIIDNINYFLQLNRGNHLPFGGVQVVFFGDLFQLPPVVATEFEKQYFRERYETSYFFSSDVLKSKAIDVKTIQLNQVFRQTERKFVGLLDSIRRADINEEDLQTLNERFLTLPEDKKYIINLCTINATADKINQKEMEAIAEQPRVYNAKIEGEFAANLYPTDLSLILKKGAQIMFIRNDIERRYVNGTIGIITKIENDEVWAMVSDQNGEEKEILVSQESWEIIRYENQRGMSTDIDIKVLGTFTQLPIKLAWALTIHKSQGKTFDKVIIDLGRGAFDYGQTYVALSRCRTLEGIYLTRPVTYRDIMIDQVVVDYFDQLRRYS